MPVEELMGQLVQRASEIVTSQQRLQALLAANRSIVSELSLSKVLQRIVEAARETVSARYAALGVIGSDGALERLVPDGLDDATVAAISDVPSGQALLGPLAGSPEPDQVTGSPADPRRTGDLDDQPPMPAFLSVPVRSGGAEFARLFLAEPAHGGAFTEQDEELVAALAATAGIAIENARRYEESRRRQQWLLASSEISQRLLALTEREEEYEIWRLISATVRQLAEADVVSLIMPVDGDPPLLQIKVASGAGQELLEGMTYPRGDSVAWQVMQQDEAVVVSTHGSPHLRDLRTADGFSGPSMVLPLRGEVGSRGVLAIGRQPGQPTFTTADVDMAEDFAGQAAIAIELAEARSAQQRLGALEDRERIARDLHDHVIQRLFATGLTLQSTAGVTHSSEVQERLGQTVEDLDETIRQIRTSIFALKYSKPAVSSIRATVLTVADDMAPTLGFRPATHLVGPLDTIADETLVADVAAVLHEALTNVVRHARARSTSVTVEAGAERLTVVVDDDGQGLAPGSRLSGLVDVRARAEARGGSLVMDQAQGGGTRLTWSIPLT